MSSRRDFVITNQVKNKDIGATNAKTDLYQMMASGK
jgi:hypothetical protein